MLHHPHCNPSLTTFFLSHFQEYESHLFPISDNKYLCLFLLEYEKKYFDINFM